MAESKTAKKSKPSKPDANAFTPDPNCERLVPLRSGRFLLRHPVSGRTLNVSKADVEVLLEGELASHALAGRIRAELG